MARLHAHCHTVGRDPDEVEVTHLGTVVVGADPRDVHARIERLRPADVGPDRFADRAAAGTVDDHELAFRRLADAGVQTAIVSVPDVAMPGSLAPFADLIARLR